MDNTKRQRCVYVTARQKKKLIELMTKNPELISCKVTQDFNYKDSQKLWQNIANECNSIPGARKTWRQWRKTWHDLRSNTKKKQNETSGELSISSITLTTAEQEALGVKNSSLIDNNYDVKTEFVHLGGSQSEHLNDEMSPATLSESESPIDLPFESNPEISEQKKRKVKIKNGLKHSPKHISDCVFNCDVMAVQEQRKIDLKESYLDFKKDYLKQKLKLLREQTEALKSIAKELSK